MALGLTQPLTERSTRDLMGGKGSQCIGLTTLLPSCAYCVRACPDHYRNSFALLFQSEKCSWYIAVMCAM